MNVVIIGLGYVGLPLAQEAVSAGLNVTGLDVKQATVDSLNSGRSHIDDLSDADAVEMAQPAPFQRMSSRRSPEVLTVTESLSPQSGLSPAAEQVGCSRRPAFRGFL